MKVPPTPAFLILLGGRFSRLNRRSHVRCEGPGPFLSHELAAGTQAGSQGLHLHVAKKTERVVGSGTCNKGSRNHEETMEPCWDPHHVCFSGMLNASNGS